jgi:hypothetical protein
LQRPDRLGRTSLWVHKIRRSVSCSTNPPRRSIERTATSCLRSVGVHRVSLNCKRFLSRLPNGMLVELRLMIDRLMALTLSIDRRYSFVLEPDRRPYGDQGRESPSRRRQRQAYHLRVRGSFHCILYRSKRETFTPSLVSRSQVQRTSSSAASSMRLRKHASTRSVVRTDSHQSSHDKVHRCYGKRDPITSSSASPDVFVLLVHPSNSPRQY